MYAEDDGYIDDYISCNHCMRRVECLLLGRGASHAPLIRCVTTSQLRCLASHDSGHRDEGKEGPRHMQTRRLAWAECELVVEVEER